MTVSKCVKGGRKASAARGRRAESDPLRAPQTGSKVSEGCPSSWLKLWVAAREGAPPTRSPFPAVDENVFNRRCLCCQELVCHAIASVATATVCGSSSEAQQHVPTGNGPVPEALLLWGADPRPQRLQPSHMIPRLSSVVVLGCMNFSVGLVFYGSVNAPLGGPGSA